MQKLYRSHLLAFHQRQAEMCDGRQYKNYDQFTPYCGIFKCFIFLSRHADSEQKSLYSNEGVMIVYVV